MFLWLKAFHLIAVICWFAGIFYLPRLFVYHAMAEDQVSRERFKIMERKLYRGIMNPSMIVTVVLGLWMLISHWDLYKTQGWMHAKLALVVLLIGYHHMCLAHLKKFAADANTKSHRFFRVFNEVPVLLLVGIVILVVVKPF
ncbi:putative membrane protein [Alloalcanivorax dieselolei B5]|uniref:Protoporphyrinogen IX oxidase n=1 Tax=Alcanivorax dieselolei (strain DSM 16502 / CGMCC 1.3690 / MCCC 1A00001 / B-5) TaxID=930169 RepID=K0CJY9_ALCDB|nr:protoporphyrinogen oxidase HemJ [Alloalcanivorax dieselolei]AFT72087.1 putative membrane protein [Alloalcanivorax dieselolei B5]GGJ75063.1 TIGR00701 family protein [Alloalcanivorax dieselolei]